MAPGGAKSLAPPALPVVDSPDNGSYRGITPATEIHPRPHFGVSCLKGDLHARFPTHVSGFKIITDFKPLRTTDARYGQDT